jgi:hypothetical protein
VGLILICGVPAHSAVAFELESTAPEAVGATAVAISGGRGGERLSIDDDNVRHTAIGRVAVASENAFSSGVFRFDFERLKRDVSEPAAALGDTNSAKATSMFMPGLELSLGDGWSVTLAHMVIRTAVESDAVPDDEGYTLHGNRTRIGAAYEAAPRRCELAVASAVRAEKTLELDAGDVKDRDYVPLQLDFGYAQTMATDLVLRLGIRYSRYDAGVFEEHFDKEDKPSASLQDINDYYVSWQIGADYALTRLLTLKTEARRKAALDTSSYTVDDYVVAYSGRVGLSAHFGDDAKYEAGLEYFRSAGSMTHSVEGRDYDYAERLESVQGTLGVKM